MAARIAVERGYSNVSAFQGGIPEWQGLYNYPMTVSEKYRAVEVKVLSPEKFKKLMKGDKVCILDVRAVGLGADKPVIEGSIFCPLVFLFDRHAKILSKDKQILIADWVMKQSISAAKFLALEGYQIAGVLRGGISRWESEGLPTVKRSPPQE